MGAASRQEVCHEQGALAVGLLAMLVTGPSPHRRTLGSDACWDGAHPFALLLFCRRRAGRGVLLGKPAGAGQRRGAVARHFSARPVLLCGEQGPAGWLACHDIGKAAQQE